MPDPLLHRGDGPKPDRDQWCSPLIITDAVGPVDLDPCANARSHVQARRTFRLDRGQNGLVLARFVAALTLTYINPPFSRGNVAKWIAAYAHVRFIFMLRMDTSTKWFADVEGRSEAIAVLREQRTNFEAPPGVDGDDSNTFPHCLFYARAADITDAIRDLCYIWEPKRCRPSTESSRCL